MNFSNLSNAEYYKLNGTLDSDRIEAMLDKEANVPSRKLLDEIQGEIQESQPSFEEDVLAGILDDMGALAKNVRGENKYLAEDLLKKLEQLETSIVQAMEYNSEKVASAIESLNKIVCID